LLESSSFRDDDGDDDNDTIETESVEDVLVGIPSVDESRSNMIQNVMKMHIMKTKTKCEHDKDEE